MKTGCEYPDSCANPHCRHGVANLAAAAATAGDDATPPTLPAPGQAMVVKAFGLAKESTAGAHPVYHWCVPRPAAPVVAPPLPAPVNSAAGAGGAGAGHGDVDMTAHHRSMVDVAANKPAKRRRERKKGPEKRTAKDRVAGAFFG